MSSAHTNNKCQHETHSSRSIKIKLLPKLCWDCHEVDMLLARRDMTERLLKATLSPNQTNMLLVAI